MPGVVLDGKPDCEVGVGSSKDVGNSMPFVWTGEKSGNPGISQKRLANLGN